MSDLKILKSDINKIRDQKSYSVLKLFTGFINAARIVWKLTVINAMNSAARPATANIHQLTSIRYAKSRSHLFMKYHESGAAIMNAITTNFIKSFESI